MKEVKSLLAAIGMPPWTVLFMDGYEVPLTSWLRSEGCRTILEQQQLDASRRITLADLIPPWTRGMPLVLWQQKHGSSI